MKSSWKKLQELSNPHFRVYPLVKSFFDRLFSLIGVLIISPLLLLIAMILSVTGEKKIFYLQKRIGYQNKVFHILKFATMLENSPNMGTGSITLRNDPRVTKVGRYLRISKLNELPQLINVLTGDMSFVGPRPQTDNDFNVFTQEVKDNIYKVKPGITGIGSIIFRDEEKMISDSNLDARTFYDDVIAPYKGEVEMWYQKNRSFWLDLKILILTAKVVIWPASDNISTWFPTLPKMEKSNEQTA